MQKLNCLAAALALAGLSCQPLWAHGSLELDAERLMGLSLQELIATPVVTASRQVETAARRRRKSWSSRANKSASGATRAWPT